MQGQQCLVYQCIDHIIVFGIPFRARHPQCSRKTDHVIAERPTFNRPWISNEIEVRVGFPTFSLESSTAHFGRN